MWRLLNRAAWWSSSLISRDWWLWCDWSQYWCICSWRYWCCRVLKYSYSRINNYRRIPNWPVSFRNVRINIPLKAWRDNLLAFILWIILRYCWAWCWCRWRCCLLGIVLSNRSCTVKNKWIIWANCFWNVTWVYISFHLPLKAAWWCRGRWHYWRVCCCWIFKVMEVAAEGGCYYYDWV